MRRKHFLALLVAAPFIRLPEVAEVGTAVMAPPLSPLDQCAQLSAIIHKVYKGKVVPHLSSSASNPLALMRGYQATPPHEFAGKKLVFEVS